MPVRGDPADVTAELRRYADALDKDRGHVRSPISSLVREAAELNDAYVAEVTALKARLLAAEQALRDAAAASSATRQVVGLTADAIGRGTVVAVSIPIDEWNALRDSLIGDIRRPSGGETTV